MGARHVAIIMDGNGRWAKQRGLDRTAGHKEGAKAVRRIVRHAREQGLEWLTLFAFSSLNWARPPYEVRELMDLLVQFLADEEPELLANGIRLTAIGERAYLPRYVREALERVERSTAHCRDMRLVLAVSYDGRRDVVQAVRRTGTVAMEEPLAEALSEFRRFNYQHIYMRPASLEQNAAVIAVLRALVEHFGEQPAAMPRPAAARGELVPGSEAALREAVTYVGGMTDRYAFTQAIELLGWRAQDLPVGIA